MSFLQSSNAHLPTSFNESGSVSDVSPPQCRNAFLPIVCNEFGSVTDVSTTDEDDGDEELHLSSAVTEYRTPESAVR